MKTLRLLLVVVVVAVGLLAVWRFMPGCREKVKGFVQEQGGWTEEARRADPVGFVEYAQQQLESDLQKLEDARERLATAREDIGAEEERIQERLTAARDLAEEFRQGYQAAEETATWPVTLQGRDYSREELVEQVRLFLLQRNSYEQTLQDLAEAEEAAADKRQEVVSKITGTQAALASLPAKKEIARVNQLTGRTEELLEQVNELIGENREVLSESPVRTVEELVARREEPPAEGEGDVNVTAFLEATE